VDIIWLAQYVPKVCQGCLLDELHENRCDDGYACSRGEQRQNETITFFLLSLAELLQGSEVFEEVGVSHVQEWSDEPLPVCE
jgi:hypothetical protein